MNCDFRCRLGGQYAPIAYWLKYSGYPEMLWGLCSDCLVYFSGLGQGYTTISVATVEKEILVRLKDESVFGFRDGPKDVVLDLSEDIFFRTPLTCTNK